SPPAVVCDDAVFSFVLEAPMADQAAVIDSLCAELEDFGTAAIEARAASAEQPWRLRIAGCRDIGAASEVIAFVAREVQLVPAAPAAAEASADAAAWGLFEEDASASADDGWGLFETTSLPAPAPEADAA